VVTSDLERARELGVRESGLAVAITYRGDGSAHASVVNAGVLDHPITGEQVVAFVVRGYAKKLINMRRRSDATVVFRSGWEWVAVEGTVALAGPDDTLHGLPASELPHLLRTVYAAAAPVFRDQLHEWLGRHGF
jgi:hypothetical protein